MRGEARTPTSQKVVVGSVPSCVGHVAKDCVGNRVAVMDSGGHVVIQISGRGVASTVAIGSK
eukprot:8179911-Alexandrium_andersonii.AAC.1